MTILLEALLFGVLVYYFDRRFSEMAVTTQELVDEVAQIRAELETYKAVVQAIKDALAAAQEAGVNAIDGDAVKAALDGLEADVPKGE